MFKQSLIIILTMLCFQVNSQNIIGKKMESKISSSCKRFSEGGCTLNHYQILKFEKDSVFISYKTVPKCTPVERNKLYKNMTDENLFKSYKWRIVGNEVLIENFNDYEKIMLVENKIITLNKEKEENIFIEITK